MMMASPRPALGRDRGRESQLPPGGTRDGGDLVRALVPDPLGRHPAVAAELNIHLPELVDPDQSGPPSAGPVQVQYRRTEQSLDLLAGHADGNRGREGFHVLAATKYQNGHANQDEADQRRGNEQMATGAG